MDTPQPPFSGSCLCGAVTVRITTEPLLTLACHCHDCQKLTASAYSLTTMFSIEGVSLSGPVTQGGLGSAGRAHFFCTACKTFVYSQIGGAQQRINLRTSVLDDAAAFAPFVELMTEQKLPWAQTPAVHSFAQYPQSQQALDALMAAYRATRQHEGS